jgi:hypothetical protein
MALPGKTHGKIWLSSRFQKYNTKYLDHHSLSTPRLLCPTYVSRETSLPSLPQHANTRPLTHVSRETSQPALVHHIDASRSSMFHVKHASFCQWDKR